MIEEIEIVIETVEIEGTEIEGTEIAETETEIANLELIETAVKRTEEKETVETATHVIVRIKPTLTITNPKTLRMDLVTQKNQIKPKGNGVALPPLLNQSVPNGKRIPWKINTLMTT